MSGAWLLPVVSAGLLGSVHCVGMCGGLVAVASDGSRSWRSRLAVQASYQLARLAGYAALGALAGSLGHALDLAGEAAGAGRVAALVAGVTMVAWGLVAMLRAAGVRLASLRLGGLPSAFTSWLGGLRTRPPLVRAALLGGSSALLPCGFLYAFALAAAATSSALHGMLVMGALWLGNLPALLGLGLALSGALGRVRRQLPLLSAASIFVLGMLTLTSRVNVPALALSMTKPRPAATGEPFAAGSMPADCPFHRKPQP